LRNGEGPLAHRNQELGSLEFDEFPLDQFAARLGKEHLLPVVLQLKRLIALHQVFPVQRARFLFR
jgi:hypothetical protein